MSGPGGSASGATLSSRARRPGLLSIRAPPPDGLYGASASSPTNNLQRALDDVGFDNLDLERWSARPPEVEDEAYKHESEDRVLQPSRDSLLREQLQGPHDLQGPPEDPYFSEADEDIRRGTNIASIISMDDEKSPHREVDFRDLTFLRAARLGPEEARTSSASGLQDEDDEDSALAEKRLHLMLDRLVDETETLLATGANPLLSGGAGNRTVSLLAREGTTEELGSSLRLTAPTRQMDSAAIMARAQEVLDKVGPGNQIPGQAGAGVTARAGEGSVGGANKNGRGPARPGAPPIISSTGRSTRGGTGSGPASASTEERTGEYFIPGGTIVVEDEQGATYDQLEEVSARSSASVLPPEARGPSFSADQQGEDSGQGHRAQDGGAVDAEVGKKSSAITSAGKTKTTSASGVTRLLRAPSDDEEDDDVPGQMELPPRGGGPSVIIKGMIVNPPDPEELDKNVRHTHRSTGSDRHSKASARGNQVGRDESFETRESLGLLEPQPKQTGTARFGSKGSESPASPLSNSFTFMPGTFEKQSMSEMAARATDGSAAFSGVVDFENLPSDGSAIGGGRGASFVQNASMGGGGPSALPARDSGIVMKGSGSAVATGPDLGVPTLGRAEGALPATSEGSLQEAEPAAAKQRGQVASSSPTINPSSSPGQGLAPFPKGPRLPSYIFRENQQQAREVLAAANIPKPREPPRPQQNQQAVATQKTQQRPPALDDSAALRSASAPTSSSPSPASGSVPGFTTTDVSRPISPTTPPYAHGADNFYGNYNNDQIQPQQDEELLPGEQAPLLQEMSVDMMIGNSRARALNRANFNRGPGPFSSLLYDSNGNFIGDPGLVARGETALRARSRMGSGADLQGTGAAGGSRPPTTRRRKKTFLEYFLRQAQKPEVILLAVWWLIMFSLLLFVADLWSILVEIWKPLAFLILVPVVGILVLLVVTL